MNNLLIVEGKSDKAIIDSLIKHMNLDIDIKNPICNIDKCESLNGIGELEKKLRSLFRRIKGESISTVGIIFDADKVGIEQRSQEIQEKIDLVFGTSSTVNFKIHILNVDGYGELEDILKKIVSNEPTMADCLGSWQECLGKKKLNSKELNKLWIQVYEKYDCCTIEEQENMRDNCNKKILLEDKKIYNFDKKIQELNTLKTFLTELGDN